MKLKVGGIYLMRCGQIAIIKEYDPKYPNAYDHYRGFVPNQSYTTGWGEDGKWLDSEIRVPYDIVADLNHANS